MSRQIASRHFTLVYSADRLQVLTSSKLDASGETGPEAPVLTRPFRWQGLNYLIKMTMDSGLKPLPHCLLFHHFYFFHGDPPRFLAHPPLLSST